MFLLASRHWCRQWTICMFVGPIGADTPYIRYRSCFPEEALQGLEERAFFQTPGSSGEYHLKCFRICREHDEPHMALSGREDGTACLCGGERFAIAFRLEVEHMKCGGPYGHGLYWAPTAFASLYFIDRPLVSQEDEDRWKEQCLDIDTSFFHRMFKEPHGLKEPYDVLPVIMNTRFILKALTLWMSIAVILRLKIDVLDPQSQIERLYDCPNSDTDPKEFSNRLLAHNGNLFALKLWKKRSIFLESSMTMLTDCPVGLLAIMIANYNQAQESWTQEAATFGIKVAEAVAFTKQTLATFAPGTFHLQFDFFTILLLTAWPVLTEVFLGAKFSLRFADHKHSPQYKPFDLDLRADEVAVPLAGLADSEVTVEDLHRAPIDQHLASIRSVLARTRFASDAVSATYSFLLRALELNLMQERGQHSAKFMLLNVMWGTKYAGYLRNILLRSEAFGLGSRHLVFCLDSESYDGCVVSHPYHALCIPGRVRSMTQKYNIVAAVVHSGFDALLVDLDVVILRNPIPVILQTAHAQNAEVLTSRDFGGNCLNTGITFFKATNGTSLFITELISWLWRHPHEFCQKAFGGLLGYDNLTYPEVSGYPYTKLPRWGFLDMETHFGTNVVYNKGIEGWTGRIEDIVIYHFLEGGGGVDQSAAFFGKHANLFDLFYANPKLDVRNIDIPLWVQDPDIETQLYSARLPAPIQRLAPCEPFSSLAAR
eukprot:TRINITY_DN27189_c0_g1_i3.p1 TRINITY_DN27189_c0_g1~~TRINITY_DN27189_c0_g1_i3.p1  ORF type:complete len:712 (-),score=133.75 TRINITY_DN27189_c0_g1_i3:452-2587(-)